MKLTMVSRYTSYSKPNVTSCRGGFALYYLYETFSYLWRQTFSTTQLYQQQTPVTNGPLTILLA